MTEQCIAKGCRNPAVLNAVDKVASIFEREQMPACTVHARLWLRQSRGSFWWFPLGDDEADSLTQAEIAKALA
jgi:hypothetical protein